MSQTTVAVDTESIAKALLRSIFVSTLLRFEDAVKISDLQAACPLPIADSNITRYILASHPSVFVSTERRWTLSARYEEPNRPLHSHIRSLLREAGQPVALSAISAHLAHVYRRTPQAMAQLVHRLTEQHFFRLPDNRIGLPEWLLRLDYGNAEDIAYYNYVDWDAAQRTLERHPTFDGSPQSVEQVLREAGAPLSLKFVAFLQWYVQRDRFVPLSAYQQLVESPGLLSFTLSTNEEWEPNAYWALTEWVPQWVEALRPQAQQAALGWTQQMAEPLVLSVAEVESMVQRILQSDKLVTSEELALQFFDLTESDPTYANDVETITRSLRQDERIMWLGATRFVNPRQLPPYLFEVPESLRFPEVQFYTEEGEPLEIDLEDEGLSGTLRSDILDPVAQDVGDEEGGLSIFPVPQSVRCVLKARHKEIGTFPLCQIPAGFFQEEPEFQQVTFIDESTGQRYPEVYVNQRERLIFGLLDWYSTREAVSGLVFTLSRTEDPFVFTVRWEEQLDQRIHISRSRYDELLDMSTRMMQTYSTFDIICEILSSHRGGMEFLSILSEVNVIRRTRRRRVASVLSAFQAFYLRGGLWHLDEKKRDAGIDRAKRKHIRK